jgi:hypothetical protein
MKGPIGGDQSEGHNRLCTLEGGPSQPAFVSAVRRER